MAENAFSCPALPAVRDKAEGAEIHLTRSWGFDHSKIREPVNEEGTAPRRPVMDKGAAAGNTRRRIGSGQGLVRREYPGAATAPSRWFRLLSPHAQVQCCKTG